MGMGRSGGIPWLMTSWGIDNDNYDPQSTPIDADSIPHARAPRRDEESARSKKSEGSSETKMFLTRLTRLTRFWFCHSGHRGTQRYK